MTDHYNAIVTHRQGRATARAYAPRESLPGWQSTRQRISGPLRFCNQAAFYSVDYAEDEKAMPFAKHENGIQWKILAILWSSETTKLTKIAGDTLVS